MNKETRIQKIAEVVKSSQDNEKEFLQVEIPWKNELKIERVYKIPLSYLIYNKYNGRILSRTKSLESQKHNIDVESEEGRDIIEKLLWDSKPIRNKQTLESLKKFGQEKVGIITRDGIIIDGNRRAMLLNKIDRFGYFKAVVLEVTLEENPLEIQKLETSFQMGEDEKVDYNPIEKYLKAKELYSMLAQKEYNPKDENKDAIKQIAEWMGKADEPSEIIKYLSTVKTMDDYLDYLGYTGIYTQLDEREEQFIELTKWLEKFYGKGAQDGFVGYKDSDVDELKMISFDYIRVKYKNEEFRKIARGRKENHIWGDKKIWEDFRDFHFKNTQIIKDEESVVDYQSENLESHLNARDDSFFRKTLNDSGKSFLFENIDTHFAQVGYNQAADKPLKLVNIAMKAVEAINYNHPSFSAPDVLNEVELLNKKISEMLGKKSASTLLMHIIYLLGLIGIKANEDSKEEILPKIKDIEKIAYQLEKEAKSL